MPTRYPGVASFTDSKLAQQLFFGRKEDGDRLFYHILSENLTVLYAKSGYGKTSLLQARVFALLREQNYYPLSVRFNKPGWSPQDIIKFEIGQTTHPDYEIIIHNKEGALADFLEGVEIWSKDNKLATLVLILDQFEEIFTLDHNYEHRERFINDLSYLLSAAKDGRIRVRFVISLREDYLGHLEKLAIKIPSIFSNRYRLGPLSPGGAAQAINEPALAELPDTQFDSVKMVFEDAALEELMKFLSLRFIDKRWVESGEIEPVQLQIICSTLEEKAIAMRKGGSDEPYNITKADLGGTSGLRNILVTFYDNQIRRLQTSLQLSAKELSAIQNLVESELIANGKRIPLEYDSVLSKEHIRKEAIEALTSQKLFRVEVFNNNRLIEISHDTLVEPILMSRERRDAEREKVRKKRIAQTFIALLTCVFIIVAVVLWVRVRVERSEKMLELAHADSIARMEKLEKDERYINSFGKLDSSKSNLEERIKADSFLQLMTARTAPSPGLTIEYYKKTLDQEKVHLALKELGYERIKTLESINPRLENGETNTVVYTDRVKLSDVKLIVLTLIRAGYNIQHVIRSDRRPTDTLVQVIRMAYEGIPDDAPVYGADEVVRASSIGQLARTNSIDVFYLDDIVAESRPRAEKIVSLLRTSFPYYAVNLRLLSSKVNKSNPGFGIQQNMIHCEQSEFGLADSVLQLIKANHVFQLEQPVIRKVEFKTPAYISVFVRNM